MLAELTSGQALPPSTSIPPWPRDVLGTAAQLGLDEKEQARLLVLVAETSRRLRSDRSSLLDLDRRLRILVARLSSPLAEEVWGRLDAIGVPRIDPYASDREARREEEPREGPPSVPDFPPEEEPPPAAKIETITADDVLAIGDAVDSGAKLVGLPPSAEPAKIAAAVDRWVCDVREGKRAVSQAHTIALGALWGHAVVGCAAARFRWVRIVAGSDSMLGIASEDDAYACAPLHVVASQLDRGRETTALLLFDMIAANRLPPRRPGQVTFIA